MCTDLFPQSGGQLLVIIDYARERRSGTQTAQTTMAVAEGATLMRCDTCTLWTDNRL